MAMERGLELTHRLNYFLSLVLFSAVRRYEPTIMPMQIGGTKNYSRRRSNNNG
jgi:hypothetical protein